MAKAKQFPGVRFIADDCQTEFTLSDGCVFKEFHFLTDCKFSTINSAAGFSIEGLENVIIPGGSVIKAPVLSFKLNSGSLLVYFGPVDLNVNVQ
jgi:hypothetical protein